MINLLISIPGPVFLLLYIAIAVIAIVFSKNYMEKSDTKTRELPETDSLSPLDIAVLSKGPRGALMFSIFNLWRKKRIEISRNGKSIEIKKISDDQSTLNQCEKDILSKLQSQSNYKTMFSAQTLGYIEKLIEPNVAFLEDSDLLMKQSEMPRLRTVTLVIFALMLAFGGAKMYLGILRDKPVGFLIFLMIVSFIVFLALVKPFSRRATKRGKLFLKNAQRRFEWVKQGDNANNADDNVLLYTVALLGTTAIAGTAFGSMLGDASMIDSNAASSFSSSGCGGSSCSGSSCSGSSCSGSSCGGGGCGGCGGGD